LLNGYFSACRDGTIGKNSIESSFASYRLTEGITLLCSRLGIFATTQTISNTNHRLTSHWAELFSNKIELISRPKNEKLKVILCSDEHRNFEVHNYVVLDNIVEINVVGVEKHPKVYDLTIPSTLNFGLANGLQVRDTSETGYIQRKLVKAMEDCKTSYDYSVRNASKSIIQFVYGEDGMDSTKLESQYIPYIGIIPDDMYKQYFIHSDLTEIKSIIYPEVFEVLLQNSKNFNDKMKKHIKQLIEDREFIITKIFKGRQDNKIMYPVSFQRIIENIYESYPKTPISDLNPLYVLDMIDKLSNEMYVVSHQKANKFFSNINTYLFEP